MRKLCFVILASAALWLSTRLPFEKTDVGKLSPVSLLLIESCDGKLNILSDRGDSGVGDSLAEALEDLELTSPGRIFLDTVEHLVIMDGTEVDGQALGDYFRPGTYLCVSGGAVDPGEAAEFLRGHRVKMTLREYEVENGPLPVLIQQDGRYYLNGETSRADPA